MIYIYIYDIHNEKNYIIMTTYLKNIFDLCLYQFILSLCIYWFM